MDEQTTQTETPKETSKKKIAKKIGKVVLIIGGLLLLTLAGLTVLWIYLSVTTGSGGFNADDADKLGSWGQINQEITRGPDWQQIVHDSPFQLGPKEISGYWEEPEGKVPYYRLNFGTYPSIDGSTVAVPMAIEFAWQHLGLSDADANDFVGFSTTHDAYFNLIHKRGNTLSYLPSENLYSSEDHPVDLLIGTEPSDAELEMAKENDVILVKKPVCYDAFVFITHKDNPIDSLTLDQIRDIYSGKITNWKEVGGDDIAIIAYQREENSGSQTAMENLVMNGVEMVSPEMAEVSLGMGQLVDAVAEYQNDAASIGYTYKYYIDTLYKNEDIKILAIDGFEPDEQNVRDRSYPLSTNYYGVIRAGDEDAVGGKFLDWMLSEEGQRCIAQAGYIPYLDH